MIWVFIIQLYLRFCILKFFVITEKKNLVCLSFPIGKAEGKITHSNILNEVWKGRMPVSTASLDWVGWPSPPFLV